MFAMFFIGGLILFSAVAITSLYLAVQIANKLLECMTRLGNQGAELASVIREAGSCFAPIRHVPCPKCGGLGKIEKENPLLAALAESLHHPPRKH